jgi:hypothetical protein
MQKTLCFNKNHLIEASITKERLYIYYVPEKEKLHIKCISSMDSVTQLDILLFMSVCLSYLKSSLCSASLLAGFMQSGSL